MQQKPEEPNEGLSIMFVCCATDFCCKESRVKLSVQLHRMMQLNMELGQIF